MMNLTLHNSLTRTDSVFTPLDRKNVRMYVCGPTVYDFAHIGNARPVIVFDVLFRLLRHIYGADHVTYVRNITDVDDKINARAAEEYPDLPLNEAIRKVTEKTDRQFHEDVAALGCLPPTVEPRATEHIAEMRALIDRLVASGNAYVAEDNVLFSVPSMPDYGKLSRRPLDEMIAGARVEVAPYKRDAMDFVLWKPSKPGEPAWPSPAGITTPGRPGWHIECSAMADKWLWTEALSKLSESGHAHPHQFDIHGGGIDLLFPHHEDEIAQSRCAFQTPALANYWMHNGFLQVEGEKMSKSLGNFVTIRELRKRKKFGKRKWLGNVIRFAMLQSHYTQPIDWSVRLLEQSESRLVKWQDFVKERTLRRTNRVIFYEFISALADNLNTPAAFSIIDEAINQERLPEDRYTIYRIMRLLGIRSKKSRIAKLAESFQKRSLELQELLHNEHDRVLFSSALESLTGHSGVSQITIAGCLSGLEQFWEENSFAPIPVMQFANELSVLQSKVIHKKTPRLERLARNLNGLADQLGVLTSNDWMNISKTATTNPIFKSGKLKPEAIFFFYFYNMIRFSKEAKADHLLTSMQYSSVKSDFLNRARPAPSEFETQVRRMVANRIEAKKARDFDRADRIREDLTKMGVVLKDTKDGTTWEKIAQ
jgi:cysteinyl-tRNA synthetase